MTIKVGDTVRVIEDSGLFNCTNDGKTGTVTAIYYDRDRVEVLFESGFEDYGFIEDVVLVSESGAAIPTVDTTVAQKLAQIEALVAEIKTILG